MRINTFSGGDRNMITPNSPSLLLAEQLRIAFDGDAWHGPSVLELLKDVNPATAAARRRAGRRTRARASLRGANA